MRLSPSAAALLLLSVPTYAKSSSFSTSKKGSSSSSGKKGSSSSDEEEESVCPLGTMETVIDVSCDDTITTTTLLTADLLCDSSDSSALTISGAGTVLDCQGQSIIGERKEIGLVVTDGATARNCDVSNFANGIRIEGSGTLENVTSTGNVDKGLIIRPEVDASTITVTGSEFSNNEGDGVEVVADGVDLTLNIDGLVATGNDGDGIDVFGVGGGAITGTLKDLTLVQNAEDGLDITKGPHMITLTGDNEISENEEDGIVVGMDGSTGVLTIEGPTLNVLNNVDDGIQVNDDNTLTFVESAAPVMDAFLIGGSGDADLEVSSGTSSVVNFTPDVTCETVGGSGAPAGGCPIMGAGVPDGEAPAIECTTVMVGP